MKIEFDRKAMAAAATAAAAPDVERYAEAIERNLLASAKRQGHKMIDVKDTPTDRPHRTVMVKGYGTAAEAKSGMISRAVVSAGLRLEGK